MSDLVTLLHTAVASIVRRDHPGRLLEGEEATAWLRQDDIRYGKVATATGAVTGFPPAGAAAIADLARELRRRKPALARGVNLPDLAEAIASEIIARFGPASAPPADAAGWAGMETALDSRFAHLAVPRRHFVPCAILADKAAPFEVGPVSFVHATELAAHPRGLQNDPLTELTTGNLFQAMQERAASWVAIVEIDGCHPARSSEFADLAVDVALGALQVALRRDLSQRMTRITARTLPPWRGNLSIANGQVSSGIHNMESGHGLTGAAFDQMRQAAQPVMDAAGRSIANFIARQNSLPELRQAWCDAVYWFHEAIAEPLATIATTKYETAVEVLLRAESSDKSGARMRAAIKALTGLGENDFLPGSATLTVKQFAASLVTARSRVLHGTLSTLLADVAAEHLNLAQFARQLLLVFALQIEEYSTVLGAKDDRDSLLAWIDAERAAASAAGGSSGPS